MKGADEREYATSTCWRIDIVGGDTVGGDVKRLFVMGDGVANAIDELVVGDAVEIPAEELEEPLATSTNLALLLGLLIHPVGLIMFVFKKVADADLRDVMVVMQPYYTRSERKE